MVATWDTGWVQNGPKFDAGLRCVVMKKEHGQHRVIAWTEDEEAARAIVDALERAQGAS